MVHCFLDENELFKEWYRSHRADRIWYGTKKIRVLSNVLSFRRSTGAIEIFRRGSRQRLGTNILFRSNYGPFSRRHVCGIKVEINDMIFYVNYY